MKIYLHKKYLTQENVNLLCGIDKVFADYVVENVFWVPYKVQVGEKLAEIIRNFSWAEDETAVVLTFQTKQIYMLRNSPTEWAIVKIEG